MTIKHIQDQIESYALEVAKQAYFLGLDHAMEIHRGNRLDRDEVTDQLEEIVKNKLKGESQKE